MLSKNKIKFIHSLELKKRRKEEGLFIAEGFKTVCELLPVLPCRLLIGTSSGLHKAAGLASPAEVIEVSDDELTQASLLRTPQELLALFEIPVLSPLGRPQLRSALCLALDDVQDPGNLGTIVRMADWFGIENIFCSTGTADLYNPKTVQATMGAIARVQVRYVDLPAFLAEASKDVPVYGTFLNGENIYEAELTHNGIIVMGNEGNGIGPEVEAAVTRRLFIPPYPLGRPTSESLNVAIATAVLCSEFRRRK